MNIVVHFYIIVAPSVACRHRRAFAISVVVAVSGREVNYIIPTFLGVRMPVYAVVALAERFIRIDDD